MKVIMKKIETISYFNTKDYPLPLRFRIENERGQRYVVNIDKVNYIEKDRKAGNKILIYDCQAKIRDKLMPLQLIYDIGTYSWYLSKL